MLTIKGGHFARKILAHEASRPLIDLRDPAVARGVLDALRRKRDGTAAAPETSRWKAALNAFDITFDGRLSTARR